MADARIPDTLDAPAPSALASAKQAELIGLMEAAEAFARHAGEITLRHFGGLVRASRKGDGTPVTEADREAEQTLREDIRQRYPTHGVLGEEFGETGAGAEIRWIVDPIDGTRAFMHGVPLYGVLIGIERRGEPVVGVAHFPALDETVVAARGLGCYWNGTQAHVSTVEQVQDALVLTTDVEALLAGPVSEGWRRLQREADFSRTWGDCFGHVLVATGRADVMVDPVLSPWDAAPLLTIVQEAGGRFTTLSGDASIHGGSGVSTNGRVHETVLKMLRGA